MAFEKQSAALFHFPIGGLFFVFFGFFQRFSTFLFLYSSFFPKCLFLCLLQTYFMQKAFTFWLQFPLFFKYPAELHYLLFKVFEFCVFLELNLLFFFTPGFFLFPFQFSEKSPHFLLPFKTSSFFFSLFF